VRAHALDMYELANHNEASVRQASALRAARARVAADVERLCGQASDGAATASLLRLLSDESKRFNVELRSLAPETIEAPAPSSRRTDTLRSFAVTLNVRGRFRNIVAMLADVPRHEVLVGVRDVTLQTAQRPQSGVVSLDATVRATVYRVGKRTTEESHASQSL